MDKFEEPLPVIVYGVWRVVTVKTFKFVQRATLFSIDIIDSIEITVRTIMGTAIKDDARKSVY